MNKPPEVTPFVGHRLLYGRIGVANYPYLSKKQPMRYQFYYRSSR